MGWLTPDVTQDPGMRVLPGNGAVAQLGERELCKLEVIGSIPFSSTILRSRDARFGWQAVDTDQRHRPKTPTKDIGIREEVRSEGMQAFPVFCLLAENLTL